MLQVWSKTAPLINGFFLKTRRYWYFIPRLSLQIGALEKWVRKSEGRSQHFSLVLAKKKKKHKYLLLNSNFYTAKLNKYPVINTCICVVPTQYFLFEFLFCVSYWKHLGFLLLNWIHIMCFQALPQKYDCLNVKGEALCVRLLFRAQGMDFISNICVPQT